MTVASEISRSGPYIGNGVTTVFDYEFGIVSEEHLSVIQEIGGAETTLSLGANYTVTGVGSDGGTITITPAPASGTLITILRNVPFVQETDLENQGAYFAETIEAAFDLAASRDLQLKERLDRAVVVPASADASVLPELVANLTRLAESADEIDTVAGHIASVVTVAGISGDVTKVATIDDAVVIVAGIDEEVVDVSLIKTQVETVSGIAADVVAVSGAASTIASVAGVLDDISTVAVIASDVTTVADNIADVTNFADVYLGAKTSDPATRNDGSALQAGDLYFNTSTDQLYVYTGEEWADASAQSLNLNAKSFVGDGVEDEFTLNLSASIAANVLVWVGGVRQVPVDDYTVAGNILTILTPPGDGVSVDTLVIAVTSTLNVPADGSVTIASLSTIVKAGSVGVGSKAEMMEALAAGVSVKISASLTTINLDAADVAVFLVNSHKISADVVTTINLPAISYSVSEGEIMRISSANANLRIIGLAPTETKATSVASITGTPGDWLITYNVVSVGTAVVGDYAKLFDVAPLPVLSGDNVASYVLRDYPVLGELCVPLTNTGAMTVASGTSTATFAGGIGVLSDTIQAGNLLTSLGQTLEVTAVNDGTNTVTVNGVWAQSIASSGAFYTARRMNGAISTAGASQNVTGTGTIFTTQANVGDVLLVNGLLVKITAIASDTSMTVDVVVTIGAGSVFSILQSAACLHEGLHEITAVGASTITVRNRSTVTPPINGVSVDEFKVLKTILRHTGTNNLVVFEQQGALREMDNIALVGSAGSSGQIGVLLQNKIESELAGDGTTSFGDVTQHGLNATILFGENMGITRCGRGIMVGHGCDIDARKTAINGSLEIGVFVLENGFANLRRAQIIASGSIGLAVNSGGGVVTTELRVAGGANDGIRSDANASLYGETPMLIVNAGMNWRALDTGKFHATDGVSLLAGASGLRFESSEGRIDRMVVGANARAGIEALDLSDIQASNCWISGTSNSAGSGFGLDIDTGSRFNASFTSFVGNEGGDINLGTAVQAILKDCFYTTFSGITRVNSPNANGAVLWTGTGADTGSSVPTVGVASGSGLVTSGPALNWTRDKDRYTFDATVTVTTVGTSAGYLTLTAPFTAVATQSLHAVVSTTGVVLAAYISGSTIFIYSAAGAFPVTGGLTIKVGGSVRAT